MLNIHSRVAIAQIVFYVPIIPLSAFVVRRNGSKRPRMAWTPLLPFSLIRFAGGIVTILLDNNPGSVGLIIATLILLGVGLIPLLISMLGFIRIILASCFADQHLSHRIIILVRLLFSAAAICLVAGGSLDGNYKSKNLPSIGEKLVKAGYIVFTAILGILMAFLSYLWTRKAKLTNTSLTILKATTTAVPFLIVRAAYALLSVFANSLNSKWDSLYGSAIAFACMALLMEYIVICIYLYIGVTIPLDRQHRKHGQEEIVNVSMTDQEFEQVEVDHSTAK